MSGPNSSQTPLPRMKLGCRCEPVDRSQWHVIDYHCNYSAFNGYRCTNSDYSAVGCSACGAVWRTKAKYVETLPAAPGAPAVPTRQQPPPRRARSVCAKCGKPGGPMPGCSLGPGTEPGTLLHHKCGAVLR